MKNRIKELRKSKGLTLKQLGQQVGIAINTLSQYETGKREPKIITWKKLADFLELLFHICKAKTPFLKLETCFLKLVF